MRALLFLVLLTILVAPAHAQGNTTNETNATSTNATSANATATNETATNATPPAPAGPITIELEAVQDGGSTFFQDPKTHEHNPTIVVQPGQHVTFHVKAVAGTHNFHVASGPKTKFISDGDDDTIEWDAPTTPGVVGYWCDPHKSNGMQGKIQVGAAAAPSGSSGSAGSINGDTIDLSKQSPACSGQVAPAIVTQGVAGAPTLNDYVQKCGQTAGSAGPARPASGADYVIPISWGLIALGIVGVVWVHKFYKP